MQIAKVSILAIKTNDSIELIKQALCVLKNIYKKDTDIKKLV